MVAVFLITSIFLPDIVYLPRLSDRAIGVSTSAELIANDKVNEATEKVVDSVVYISFMKNKMINAGTGLIIDSDGYIITNQHVVKGKKEVIVKIGKKNVEGRVIGESYVDDIAIIKVSEKNLPVPEFGEKEKVKLGQLIIAIGYTLNSDKTITAGIVSGADRSKTRKESNPHFPQIIFENIIQTDAAIHRGFSGGPLIDSEGKVVGINFLSNIGLAENNIGYAIPIDKALMVASEIMIKDNIKIVER